MLQWGNLNIAYTPQLNLLYCGRVILLKRHAWRTANVRAPYWRLYWNDRAALRFKAPDGTYYPIEPTHFMLVAPNTTLSQEWTRPVEHFYTHFTVGLPFARIQSCVHRFEAHPFLIEAMRRDYVLGVIPERRAIVIPERRAMRRAATALKLCWHALSTLPPRLLPAHEDNPRLRNLLEWWETQAWRPMANSELAVRMGLHPTAFCRYFQRAIGCPPHAYGISKRIERACLLLHFSEHSIKQIAEETGFCDRYYFSSKFHQLRGISPAAFRRQYKSSR